MAGIYIHIPFCKSRCIYCGFYSTTGLELRQRYIDALCHEWLLRQQELKESLDTIYLGGGTPSQLTDKQLQQLFAFLPIATTEVTIECNPDDVSASYAATLAQLPINRVSMGVQTFDDQRLNFLHRRHTSAQVLQAIQHLRHAGIQNISIDLMYGFPDETLDDWQRDIDAALALQVEHLSAYCLMVEEGTELYRRYGDAGVRRFGTTSRTSVLALPPTHTTDKGASGTLLTSCNISRPSNKDASLANGKNWTKTRTITTASPLPCVPATVWTSQPSPTITDNTA